jgi:hypothetical protein
MSGAEVAGLVLGAMPLVIRALELGPGRDLSFHARTYGVITALYLSVSAAGGIVKRIRHRIIDHDLEQARLLKKSYTESFNMIGVAGAIIAQITFTALSLGRVSGTHWTAYGAFLVSLISGCLAVYFSCSLQLLLSALHSPDDI